MNFYSLINFDRSSIELHEKNKRMLQNKIIDL